MSNPKTASSSSAPLLYLSLRSPFARRVRVALLEKGIAFDEKVEDVFQPSKELLEANPLGRVPVIRLPSGTTICESQQILNVFCEPATPNEAAWSGIFVGLCDKIVERFLESLRPEPSQDRELFTEFEAIFERCLARAETALETQHWLSGRENPVQCDFDFGIALTYASLRVSPEWRTRFPRCAVRVDELEGRASFQKTNPNVNPK